MWLITVSCGSCAEKYLVLLEASIYLFISFPSLETKCAKILLSYVVVQACFALLLVMLCVLCVVYWQYDQEAYGLPIESVLAEC